MKRARASRQKARGVLTYPLDWYTPKIVEQGMITESEARKEYSRLREIATKRLERFKGTEFERSEAYKQNIGGFKRLSAIKDTRELQYELTRVAGFAVAKSGTISGQREIKARNIQALQESGYTFVNNSNYWQFGQFMEFSRALLKGRQYDSKRIVTIFESAQEQDDDPETILRMFEDYTRELKGNEQNNNSRRVPR